MKYFSYFQDFFDKLKYQLKELKPPNSKEEGLGDVEQPSAPPRQ